MQHMRIRTLFNGIQKMGINKGVLALILFYVCIPENWLTYLMTQLIGDNTILWKDLWKDLIIGLCFFLFGIKVLGDNMQRAAGPAFKNILTKYTKGTWTGLGAGFLITGTIQSSSATTTMLVALVSIGLIDFIHTIPIIFGANIGAAITPFLLAFNVTHHSYFLIALGGVWWQLGATKKQREIGLCITGLGLLFLGMATMSDAMKPLKDLPIFTAALSSIYQPNLSYSAYMSKLFVGVMVGTGVTAIIQSSNAFTAILIGLASQGLVSLETSFVLIMGANIGTSVTAWLASVGASNEAKRVAIVHTAFNCIGTMIFIFFVPQIVALIKNSTGLMTIIVNFMNIHMGGGQIGLEIAMGHIFFNGITALIAIMVFVKPLAHIATKIFPDKEVINEEERDYEILIKTKLPLELLEMPELTLDMALKAIDERLRECFKLTIDMLNPVIIPFVSDERLIKIDPEIDEEERELLIEMIPKRDFEFPKKWSLLEGITVREKAIDRSFKELTNYLRRIINLNLEGSKCASQKIQAYIEIIDKIEKIADKVHRDILTKLYYEKKKEIKYDFSIEGKQEFMIFHSKLIKRLRWLYNFKSEGPDQDKTALTDQKEEYESLIRMNLLHLERITNNNTISWETHDLHTSLFMRFKDINDLAIEIAENFYKIHDSEMQCTEG